MQTPRLRPSTYSTSQPSSSKSSSKPLLSALPFDSPPPPLFKWAREISASINGAGTWRYLLKPWSVSFSASLWLGPGAQRANPFVYSLSVLRRHPRLFRQFREFQVSSEARGACFANSVGNSIRKALETSFGERM